MLSAILAALLSFTPSFGDTGTLNQLSLWKYDGTNITQSVANRPFKLTGLTPGGCLQLTAGNVATTTGSPCGSGGGSGAVSTSTAETAGQLAYWTSTAATPALLGKVATSAPTFSSPLTTSGTAGAWVGGSGYTIGLDTSGSWTGNAGTATALAADGANCSAGSFPLGTDASGAAESCTDAWTEAENTAAAYFTLPSLTSGSIVFSNGTTLAQDNGNLFWSNSNDRLGLGTASPSHTFDLVKATAGDWAARIYNNSATGQGLFVASSANSTQPVFRASGADGSNTALIALANGNAGVGTTSPYKSFAVGGDAVIGASTAGGTLGDLYIPNLADAAGTFLAADPTGKLIATTTPPGTSYTFGDALTETSGDVDFDGGATPAGDLGGTWADPTVDDDGHAHTGATLSAIGAGDFSDADWGDIVISGGAASVEDDSHAHTAGTISGLGTADISGLDVSDDTNLTAGDCITLTDDDLDVDDCFILNTGDVGTGAYTFPYASTTALTTTGQIDFDSLTSAIILTGAGGVLAEYTGTSCTNQFINALSALGAATCATVQSEDINLGDTFSWNGVMDMGGAVLEIPNSTSPTADDPGELAHDTTDNQLILDDFVVAKATHKIWSATIASTSPAFISSGLLPFPIQLDGYTITAIRCYVVSGTSKVIAIEDASANSSEDITCGTTATSDDGSITNATYTAAELGNIDFGATTGAVDYVSISVFGTWTRE